ncbi:MAG: class I SAM-dependent methyltransferase [Beijerinckiaceae bacterium]|jgi:O-methyltransferase|nr:class I SAM-dependent methyltransferase [Beijerinckiaceae bacterium]
MTIPSTGQKTGSGGLLGLFRRRRSFRPLYASDGLGVKHKNISFLSDPVFEKAWATVAKANEPHWPEVPDIRWRAHVCVWAAKSALQLQGNFVELGVHTGIFSSMICHCTDFAKHADRRFFLFDTFAGIPGKGASEAESAEIARRNAVMYHRDVYAFTKAVFADVQNAELVKGVLPQSLEGIETGPIAYLSIDLNHAGAEISSAEILWPRLVPGAVIVLDDYAFAGHEEQYRAWNAFAARQGLSILTLPTGQGMLIKR